MKTFSKKIMRDIYTAYVIHLVTRPLVRYVVLSLLVLEVIAKLVFVAAVIANAKAVGIASLPSFILNALIHTHALTFLSLCVLAYLGVAMLREVMKYTYVPVRRFA